MSAFLSQDDLMELTDLRRPSAIKKWLGNHGYNFDVAASGWPKVLWSAVEQRQGIGSSRRRNDEPEPDFSQVRHGQAA